MDVTQFFTLLIIVFVFVVTPGPGTLAIFSKRLLTGFLPAFYLSLGIVFGDLVYLILVIFSLEALSEFVVSFLQYVQVLGAIYLIYLGVTTWRAKMEVSQSKAEQYESFGKEILRGMLIGLTNPKTIIFYIVLLPTFVDLSDVGLLHAIQIIFTVKIGLLLGATLINVITGQIGKRFVKTDILSKLSAVVMVAAGLLLGLS